MNGNTASVSDDSWKKICISEKCFCVQRLSCISVTRISLTRLLFGDTKLNNDYIIKRPSRLTIGFLEACKQLIHCCIKLPFFLKNFTNADYMVNWIKYCMQPIKS